MNDETTEVTETTRKNRIILILLASFFAVPYLIVFIYQSYPELSLKTGMSNRGDLFSPIHSIEQVANDELKALRGKWVMIYVSGSSCDQDCVNQHYTMRQVRLASAKRRFKLERLNLVVTGSIDADYKRTLEKFPGEKMVMLDAANVVMREFDELPPEQQMGRIYLMDPHLNIVLRYEAITDPKDLLHDIKKLVTE